MGTDPAIRRRVCFCVNRERKAPPAGSNRPGALHCGGGEDYASACSGLESMGLTTKMTITKPITVTMAAMRKTELTPP